jgi:hypothetical protein
MHLKIGNAIFNGLLCCCAWSAGLEKSN